MSKANEREVRTKKFRVSWPAVFHPSKNNINPDAEPKYSVTALFPAGTDMKELEAAVQAACVKKWGENKKKWPSGLRSPFRKHEEFAEENDDGKLVFKPGMEPGGILIRMTSKDQPEIVENDGKTRIEAESDFYAGCYARAFVQAYAYDVPGNKGVAFGLICLQKISDGEPLTGRPKPQDVFSPIADDEIQSDGAGLFS